MRTTITLPLQDVSLFKKKALQWAQQFTEIAYYDSNMYPDVYSQFESVLAVDAFTSLKTDATSGFLELEGYFKNAKDWLFGYLGYDLKNGLENLYSSNHDGLEFPDLFFFQPKRLFFFEKDAVVIHYLNFVADEIEYDLSDINQTFLVDELLKPNLSISAKLNKAEYVNRVNRLKDYIQKGDVYEANFCMEFFSELADINPLQVYNQLNTLSHPPFAAFFRQEKNYTCCASPERYLQKKGSQLVSQPIKGTAKRGQSIQEDEWLVSQLENNPKERSENVMIVDLVRNDLSKTATKGSVEVKELCKIYTFDQVHQMISTITSTLDSAYSAVHVLETTFPMGSMTGAPKIEAMKIIEELEESKRGLYSGALGYFTPDGDFDFNVVIRSIYYNAQKKYVSFSVGSAITSEATAEAEYEECLLKAKAMINVLSTQ